MRGVGRGKPRDDTGGGTAGLLEVDVNPNPLRDSFGAIADRVADGLWQVGTAPGIGPAELPEAVRAAVTHHREAA